VQSSIHALKEPPVRTKILPFKIAELSGERPSRLNSSV
jgi:hypothetical protein